MKKITILLLCLISLTAKATDSQSDKHEPRGKAIITIYGDFHSGFGHQNDDRGFMLDRAYLGYQYKLTKSLELKAVIDAGQSDDVEDMQRLAFIKNAGLTWKHHKLTLNAGLISTTQFKTQEDFWGRRYIMKSFQDEWKFGSSADAGISAKYDFANWISADAIIVNGEGYKKIQINDGLQYGLGVTLKPLKGWTIRAYGSYNEAATDGLKDITTLSVFTGYKTKKWSIGGEYNFQTNAKHADGNDQSGVSAYTNLQINKKIGIFGRWDYLMSKNDWNRQKDGMTGVLGAEFKIGKYIKLAPNFRIWAPTDQNLQNDYYGYLNFSFAI